MRATGEQRRLLLDDAGDLDGVVKTGRADQTPRRDALDRPLDAPRVLLLRYHLEALLSAPRSVTGAQLDQLRQGWAPPQGGAHPDGGARLRITYMDLLALCRDLTPQEEQVCRLRYAPGDWGEECYERNVPLSDLERVVLYTGAESRQRRGGSPPPVLLTQQGEERIDAPLGQVAAGRALVRGRKARWPSYLEIAEVLWDSRGLTARQVQRLLDSALIKVREALAGRTISEAESGDPEHRS